MALRVLGAFAVTSSYIFLDTAAVISMYQPFEPGMTITDYCPAMPFCKPNNPKHVYCENPPENYFAMSESCLEPINIRFPESVIDTMVYMINVIRSKVAIGEETGRNEQPLPRGYGMRRMVWDNQLATLAQIHANQCKFRDDIHCKATYRFPSPGHMTAISRYNKTWNDNDPGFKLQYIRDTALNVIAVWYRQKLNVTPEYVRDPPRNDREMMWYFQLIYGPATHVGCGVSAYRYNQEDGNYRKAVLMVCNFSVSPEAGSYVYNTTKPAGNVTRCGCPLPETREDRKLCLCYDAPPNSTCTNCTDTETPAVLVLPIVTYENNPRHDNSRHLLEQQYVNSSTIRNLIHTDQYNIGRYMLYKEEPHSNWTYSRINYNAEKSPITFHRRPIAKVRHRYFDEKLHPEKVHIFDNIKTLIHRRTNHEGGGSRRTNSSIGVQPENSLKIRKMFSKGSNLNTHSKHGEKNYERYAYTQRKSFGNYVQIQPRKDFTRAQNLAEEYERMKSMSSKDSIFVINKEDMVQRKLLANNEFVTANKITQDNQKEQKRENETKSNIVEVKLRNQTEIGEFVNFEPNRRSLSKDVQNFTPNSHPFNEHPYHEELEQKILPLLNKLEREFSNIQLKTNERKMLEQKIKNIYDKALKGYPTKVNLDNDHKYNTYNFTDTTVNFRNYNPAYLNETKRFLNNRNYRTHLFSTPFISKYLEYKRARLSRDNYENKYNRYREHLKGFRNIEPLTKLGRGQDIHRNEHYMLTGKTRQYYRDKLNALESKLDALYRKRGTKASSGIRHLARLDSKRKEEAAIRLAAKRARLLHGF